MRYVVIAVVIALACIALLPAAIHASRWGKQKFIKLTKEVDDKEEVLPLEHSEDITETNKVSKDD